MERVRYNEMVENLHSREADLKGKKIYLFGHCEATLVLADLLLKRGYDPAGILDNSTAKQGKEYRGIVVLKPEDILSSPEGNVCVLIVTRFYEAMHVQLRKLGFRGDVVKLVDYNTYAEYSLSEETQERKRQRVLHGRKLLEELRRRFAGAYLIFCPFNALGDIYFAMSYLPAFALKKGVERYAVCVPSEGCAAVARLFGVENVMAVPQEELDAAIQAVIYTQDESCFIAHQDRPYVVNLHKVLKLKCIPLEKVYRCGIFGLPVDTRPVEPACWRDWDGLDSIEEGKTVVLSPYAKSLPALPGELWDDVVRDYTERGYLVFTNVCGDELPLPGTRALSAELCEMKSILEKAGTFIGLRSGLCDVVRTAECRKIALYPDYNYCDTKWKAIDMYSIDGFENIAMDAQDSFLHILHTSGG